MSNVRRYRKIMEKTYTDKVTVQRLVDVKLPSGKTVQRPDVVYPDERCRLSQTGLARNKQTEAENQIEYDAKLFIAPEIVILQGDELAITRQGRTYNFIAGEPFPPYSTHQEVNLTRKERA
ncbi:ABC transporter ATP-binding protein [Paenibacillus solani]|uniref:ABC transporter ATP-binding protein n=1 Tax=Paenibacillus solani TaxID=1705565 RepID=UPI003D2B06E3